MSTFLVLAVLTLNRMYTSHMVVQREEDVRLSGTAGAGAEVSASVVGRDGVARATAGADGKWTLVLSPLAVGGPYEIRVASGSETNVLTDVLSGDVWFLTGQSNAWWPVASSGEATRESDNHWPQIRLFRSACLATFDVLDEVPFAYGWSVADTWNAENKAAVADFSAIGFFFAREIHRQLKVPVGVIQSAWPGPPISHFLPHPWNVPVTTPVKGHHQQSRDALKAAVEKLSRGEVPERTYGNSYGGMIHPFFKLPVKGVLFYQGCSDRNRSTADYLKDHERLIADYRAHWGKPDLPYYFVQLAAHDAQFMDVREAQRKTLEVPNTGMAVTIDIGEKRNIHPMNKQEAARRLALQALAKTYGRDVVCDGPLFDRVERQGRTALIHFKPSKSPLVLKSDRWFEASPTDATNDFRKVSAKVEGDAVRLTADFDIGSVRYLWRGYPEDPPSLYNTAGLPASPFHSEAE